MVRTRHGSLAVAAAEDEAAVLKLQELERSEAAATAAAEAAVIADQQRAMMMDTGEDEFGDEAELTSLTWLQSLDITSASGLPTPPCSPPLQPPQAPPARQPPKKMSPLLKAQLDLAENAEKYLTDPNKKPPYSYATLICLAMRANNNKVTLSNIYAWIRENFMFYKSADPAWQNSIRHNLSLNKCFVKLPRSKDEPGKGGFWKLDLERLEEGRRTRRRSSVIRRSKFPPKRSTHNGATAASTTTTIATMTAQPIVIAEGPAIEQVDHVAKILGTTGPKCLVLYETPPSSVSPPIPDSLPEVPESTQVNISEEDFTDLLIESAAWDDGVENQLALLDSVLDML